MGKALIRIITKLAPVLDKISPILDRKLPLFSQTVREFAGSKSNTLGVALIIAGTVILYFDIESSTGLQLVTFGCGLITLRDSVVRYGNKNN